MNNHQLLLEPKASPWSPADFCLQPLGSSAPRKTSGPKWTGMSYHSSPSSASLWVSPRPEEWTPGAGSRGLRWISMCVAMSIWAELWPYLGGKEGRWFSECSLCLFFHLLCLFQHSVISLWVCRPLFCYPFWQCQTSQSRCLGKFP